MIVLITQDALPFDRTWLATLVNALLQEDDIAGVYGRHLPYPNAPLCIQRDILGHFERMAGQPPVMRAAPHMDEATRQALHFFSNNNSAIRRSVWEKIPLPDVEFGEDQVWAERVVAAGYAKAYAHDAVVYHSHDYGVVETFRRQVTESTYYRRQFGYRLVDSPLHIPVISYHLSQSDLDYARQHPERWRLRDVIRSAPLNVARVAGQYVGGRGKGPDQA